LGPRARVNWKREKSSEGKEIQREVGSGGERYHGRKRQLRGRGDEINSFLVKEGTTTIMKERTSRGEGRKELQRNGEQNARGQIRLNSFRGGELTNG